MKPIRVLSRKVERALWKLPPGTWVAIANGKRIVATGATPSEVYEAAQAAGVKVPLLFQIPDPTIHRYFVTA